MHKTPMLRAIRTAQDDRQRFVRLTPALRNAILGAFEEFETILSVRIEKNLSTASVMEDLSGVLSLIFIIETLGEPKDNQPMVDSIQRQVERAKTSLKTTITPRNSVSIAGAPGTGKTPSLKSLRTLSEAVNEAVIEGIRAAQEKNADRYNDAKRRLAAWCEQSYVSEKRRDLALGQFKERVAEAVKPKSEPV